jgi:hypothetical protein
MYKPVFACGLALAATSPSLAQDKIIERLGPVEVNEPDLGNIGPNALIAFYSLEDGQCAVQVLTWQRSDTEAKGASRSRLILSPDEHR